MFLPVKEAEEANSTGHINATNQSTISKPRTFMQWLRMTIFTLFVLSGQSAEILLGRFYHEKGGKSKWTATLVQDAGFPIIIPYYYISPPKKPTTNSIHRNEPSTLILALIYVSLGVLQAANSMMYSVGLLHLPVSTFALICASQLTFNAFFSFLINSQKFTPFIINSLVLLTISSALLVFQTNSTNPTGNSNVNYDIGLYVDHDKIGGIKVISMVLAIWGFVSYVYQQYLDDLKSKQHEDRNANEASNASSLQEVNGS
nr:probable purine permease 10 [Quercus suber]